MKKEALERANKIVSEINLLEKEIQYINSEWNRFSSRDIIDGELSVEYHYTSQGKRYSDNINIHRKHKHAVEKMFYEIIEGLQEQKRSLEKEFEAL